MRLRSTRCGGLLRGRALTRGARPRSFTRGDGSFRKIRRARSSPRDPQSRGARRERPRRSHGRLMCSQGGVQCVLPCGNSTRWILSVGAVQGCADERDAEKSGLTARFVTITTISGHDQHHEEDDGEFYRGCPVASGSTPRGGDQTQYGTTDTPRLQRGANWWERSSLQWCGGTVGCPSVLPAHGRRAPTRSAWCAVRRG